jgi:FkbM family methyltransferase
MALPDGTVIKGPNELRNNSFEPAERDFFNDVIERVDVFVNVGANVGLYVCRALNRGKPVICFEPDVHNYKILLENIKLNSTGAGALAFNCGVGADWSLAKIFHAATGSSFHKGWANSSERYFNLAQVIRLDDLNLSRFRSFFFLVDVEGFEAQVVDGAKEIISSPVPQMWMIELMTNDDHGQIPDMSAEQIRVLDVFESNGFQLYRLSSAGVVKLDYELLRNCIHRRQEIFGHNFVFRKGLGIELARS